MYPAICFADPDLRFFAFHEELNILETLPEYPDQSALKYCAAPAALSAGARPATMPRPTKAEAAQDIALSCRHCLLEHHWPRNPPRESDDQSGHCWA
jgi:hypothetical protein